MNKLLTLLFIGSVLFFTETSFAQSSPVLYFCEKYDAVDGEIGISDRFTVGYLTVIIKCDYKLGLDNVHIQFDKYDANTLSFIFYKKFDFTIEPGMNYVYFSKTEQNDMSFEEPGFYRVYLLNSDNTTITSGLVQVIN
jgi:hypothetical protein